MPERTFRRLGQWAMCCGPVDGHEAPGGARSPSGQDSGVSLGLQHLAATVEARGADVVAQMDLARGGFHGGAGRAKRVVRTVHAALGRRLLVLLNSHVKLLERLEGGTRAHSPEASDEKPAILACYSPPHSSCPGFQDRGVIFKFFKTANGWGTAAASGSAGC